MINKNLLQNYYVQSSINYIINITEDIYTISIVERLSMCLLCGSYGSPGPIKFYTILRCKQVVTASTSTLICRLRCLGPMMWRWAPQTRYAFRH